MEVKVVLSHYIRGQDIRPLSTEFDASCSFLHISATGKLGLKKGGDKFAICLKLK